MLLRTYLKKHPEIKEFWLQSEDKSKLPDSRDECNLHDATDFLGTINLFGNRKVIKIEEEPDELTTIHIR